MCDLETARSNLPRTFAAYERWRDAGLHKGAQIYIRFEDYDWADVALGEARDGQPMRRETPMIWLSASKPIAAVALAILWERGDLDLDDPIDLFVKEFGEKGKQDITLRHVLTHTGGFRLLNLGWPQATWEEVIERICNARPEPNWIVGETAGYHLASSWFMLGEVIRRIDGRPYGQFVREEIFERICMENSWVGMPEEVFDKKQNEIGILYNTESSKAESFPWHKRLYMTRTNPGANGCGPICELAYFYRMLAGRGHLWGKDILKAPTVEALTGLHRVGTYDKTFKTVLDWGLGFIINSQQYAGSGDDDPIVPYGYGRYASRRTFGHSGRRSSTAFYDPEHDLVVAFVVNGLPDEESHNRRTRDIVEAIYQDFGIAPRDD